MEASSRSASSGEGEVEQGATLPPPSPRVRLLPHIEMRFPDRWGLQPVDIDQSTPELRVGHLPVHPNSIFLRR
jgi:hypothetical protein